jgi:hypothetical protein
MEGVYLATLASDWPQAVHKSSESAFGRPRCISINRRRAEMAAISHRMRARLRTPTSNTAMHYSANAVTTVG